MLNFRYRNPVEMVFGADAITKHLKDLVAPYKSVLLLYGGGSIKKNGVYDDVVNILGKLDCKVTEFPGIEPNPHYETCMKAMEAVRNNNVDLILAVGGGSVVDASKFIAAGAHYKGADPWDFVLSGEPQSKGVHIGAILTLPATGSEMNAGCVISRGEQKLAYFSPTGFPQFSILDPKTTYTLPERQLRNGLMDSYIHVLEQYATTVNPAAKVHDRKAEGLLLVLREIADDVMNKGNDYDTRVNLMWAATNALDGSLMTGVAPDWATHLIGHTITAIYGLDHAITLAIILPGVWEHQLESKKEKLSQYLIRVFQEDTGDTMENAKLAIKRTEEFFHSLGVKTRLGDYGIDASICDKMAPHYATTGTGLGEHGDIMADDVVAILKSRL